MTFHSNIKLRDYQQKLFDETAECYRKGFKRPLVVAPCGAGKTFLFLKMCETASQRGEVLILVHRKELLEQHKDLFAALKISLLNIRIEMILTEANHLRKSTPHLIIVDEAHLAMSASYNKVINYYNTNTIGFTATPIRLDGRPLGDIFDCLVQGVTAKWLIDNNRLSSYEYYAPTLVDVSNLKKKSGDYSQSDTEPLLMDKAIYGDVIANYCKLANGKKAIAYCVSIKHSQQVARIFNDAGIPAKHFDSNTPRAEREQIMSDFRDGKIRVLCNCMLIVEGISIDDCECCLLLRPTDSLALFIQSAMRCMRYKPNKKAVIIDYVGNYTRHGLPDDVRDWDINRVPDKKPRFNENGEYAIRECPKCFKVFKTAPKCPYCGYVYEPQGKELEEIKSVELKRITEMERKEQEKIKKQRRMQVGMARTASELWQIAKERGYKSGWVYYQMKIKGIRQ